MEKKKSYIIIPPFYSKATFLGPTLDVSRVDSEDIELSRMQAYF